MNYEWLIIFPLAFSIIVEIYVFKFLPSESKEIWKAMPRIKHVTLLVYFAGIYIFFTLKNLYGKISVLAVLSVISVTLFWKQYRYMKNHENLFPFWMTTQTIADIGFVCVFIYILYLYM